MELANTVTVNLDTLISDRQEIAVRMKKDAEQFEKLNGTIRQEMIDRGLDTYAAGEFVAVVSVRDRNTLDKGLLVELGVGVDVIEKATKASSYVQLDVRGRKS